MRCSVYGLTLDITPPVPGFHRASTDAHVDAVVRLRVADPGTLDTTPCGDVWYESDWLDDATGRPGLTIYRSIPDRRYTIEYPDGLRFVIDGDGRSITGSYSAGVSLSDLSNRLTGPVLGFVLRLRGVVALHASAVEIDGGAVAFVGDARAGKSTIAASFAQHGYRVVTEDVAALTSAAGALAICAGCTEIALRPDAADVLCGSADALPRFCDGWEKRRLDLADIGALVTEAAPLRAVYLLTNGDAVAGDPCVTDIASGSAVVELLANVYGNRLFHRELRVKELDVLHALARAVPVRVASTGAHPRFIPQLCGMLLDDLGSSSR